VTASLRDRVNVVPGAYRGVSMTELPGPLEQAALTHLLLGREVYRRTRFLVVRDPGGATAVVAVAKRSEQPLFSPITSVELLAGPDRTVYVHDPDADTAVPSELARVAVEAAPEAKAVVVQGLYEHVSFILNPAPLSVVVREVVPPHPAKLVDQVRRLLAVAEDLPPMLVSPDLVTFADLARESPAERYLLPCSGSGVSVADHPTSFLDRRPAREDWTLLGCERSREIHRWFYGDQPPTVDICPRRRADVPEVAMVTKCCLLEDEIAADGPRQVVPWGATLGQVRAALDAVAQQWEPAWRPA
jgi:hypothetical protein